MPKPHIEPTVSEDDVRRLVGELRAAGGPLTAAVLAMRMYGSAEEGDRRRIRRIASASRPGICSFPGSQGYDLIERVSDGDLLHGINAIRAQAASMTSDSYLYQSAYDLRHQPVQADLPL